VDQEDIYAPYNPEIHFIKLSDGVAVIDEVKVTDDSSPLMDSDPDAVVDSGGGSHIVWDHTIDDSHDSINYRIYDDAVPLTDTLQVSDVSCCTAHPSITLDSLNNLHVAWVYWPLTTPGEEYYELRYKKFDNDGNLLVSRKTLTTQDTSMWNPAIRADSENNLHLLWQDERDSGSSEIYYMKLDNNGSILTGDTRLTNTSPISVYPDLVIDDSGDIHVVWRDNTGYDETIYYGRYNAELIPSIEYLVIDDYRADSPSIDVDDSGNAHVLWYSSSGLYYAQVNSSGNMTKELLTSNWGGSPSIVVHNDKIHVAWHDFRYGDAEAFYKYGYFEPTTTTSTTTTTLITTTSTTSTSTSTIPALNPTNITEDIENDTIWDIGGSPYYILNDIEVDREALLWIKPGVQVIFTGAYQLYVEGNLIADGNSGSMIEFLSYVENRSEIYFEYTGDTGENRLDYCKINSTRIVSYESSVSIRDSIISGSSTDIAEGDYMTYISNNTFRQCTDVIKIRSKFDTTYVTSNEFDNCTAQVRGREDAETYILFWNNTVHRSGSGAIFQGWVDSRYNKFYNNSHGMEINDAYGHMNLSHNLVYNNSVGVYVLDRGEESLIAYNTITRNSIGILMNTLSGNYSNNNIYNNYEYSVRLIVRGHMGEDIFMLYNWWGSDDRYEIDDYIQDYYDDSQLPRIIFRPFLDEFVCEAPSIDPIADPDCDGIISSLELLDYVNGWAAGLVENSDLLDAINLWAGG